MTSSDYVHFFLVDKLKRQQTMELKSVFIILKLKSLSDGGGGQL
jgi:hypothetical protein